VPEIPLKGVFGWLAKEKNNFIGNCRNLKGRFSNFEEYCHSCWLFQSFLYSFGGFFEYLILSILYMDRSRLRTILGGYEK